MTANNKTGLSPSDVENPSEVALFLIDFSFQALVL